MTGDLGWAKGSDFQRAVRLVTFANLHLDGSSRASFTEARHQLGGQAKIVCSHFTIDQGEGAWVADGAQMCELGSVTLQEVVFSLFPSNDEFKVGAWSKVTTHLEQQDVIEGIVE
jgi:hypothetical protein